MDSIYSGAHSVRICVQEPLGSPHLADYKQLFHWLRRVDDGNTALLEPWLYPTLVGLVSLRYFKRVWVIQEVALAKEAFLLVNNLELHLTTLVIDRLARIFRHNQHETPGVFRWYPGQKIEASIFTCLHAGMYSRATDLRDRVFAVLSLMEPHARSMIPVDYGLELEPIYTHVIIAMISTQRSLDILLHVGIYKMLLNRMHFLTGEWRSSTCLSQQELHDYILNNLGNNQHKAPDGSGSGSIYQGPRLVKLEGDNVGPWRSTIDVKIVSPFDYSQEAFKHERMMCVIQMPQPMRKDLLPRFRIRAHYIDCVNETHDGSTFIPTNIYIQSGEDYDIQSPESACIHPYFDAGGGEVNNADIVNFLELCDIGRRRFLNIPCPERNDQDEKFFSGNYSVGFAPPGFEQGDEIFAIDRVRTPFILRRDEERDKDWQSTDLPHYKIVSVCYFWAALELDCWNPGTRLGRWRRGVTRPISKQTRMIEIH